MNYGRNARVVYFLWNVLFSKIDTCANKKSNQLHKMIVSTRHKLLIYQSRVKSYQCLTHILSMQLSELKSIQKCLSFQALGLLDPHDKWLLVIQACLLNSMNQAVIHFTDNKTAAHSVLMDKQSIDFAKLDSSFTSIK